jgi:DNA-binding GntR family transcriptional regulator
MAGRVNFGGRTRLVDDVAAELRERIDSGDYAPGAPLHQEELAEDLRISRTPLREAIRVLENEGLLHSERNRTVRVVSADLGRLYSAYQLREVVDGLAARLAAGAADSEAREHLVSIIDNQAAAVDPWDAGIYTRLNVEFHTAVIALADNPYLRAQIPLVRMTSQVFTPVSLIEPGRAREAVGQHRSIALAIAEGDGEASERLAREHIRSTIARISPQGDA